MNILQTIYFSNSNYFYFENNNNNNSNLFSIAKFQKLIELSKQKSKQKENSKIEELQSKIYEIIFAN